MADRYVVASGNWSSTSIWSTSNGGSPGASVPTSADDAYMLTTAYTVTLDVNATFRNFNLLLGTFNASSYNITGNAFTSYGTNTRTLNMGSGIWTLNGSTDGLGFSVQVGTSSLTLNSQNSTLIINASSNLTPVLASHTYNKVRINISGGSTVGIYGSPIISTLDIRSSDTSANQINFENSAIINVKELIMIGTSSNRLVIDGAHDANGGSLAVTDGGTSYGQFVNMKASSDFTGSTPMYIGSNSIKDSGLYWLIQDPPKMETLVDYLTETPGSNTLFYTVNNAATTSITTGYGGGGYFIYNDDFTLYSFISKDSYDLIGSSLIIEFVAKGTSVTSVTRVGPFSIEQTSTSILVANGSTAITAVTFDNTYSTAVTYRIKINHVYTVTFQIFADTGSGFEDRGTIDVDQAEASSVRVQLAQLPNGRNVQYGSINPDLTPIVVPSAGRAVKLYNGTTYDLKPIKVWDGTEWVNRPTHTWDGTEWL